MHPNDFAGFSMVVMQDSAWVQDDAGGPLMPLPSLCKVERICTETLDLHLKEHQFNEERFLWLKRFERP